MAPSIPTDSPHDRWHELLSTRYVCEICLTRFFIPYRRCPACHRSGHIRPLLRSLMSVARNETELRNLIAQGQSLPTPDHTAFSRANDTESTTQAAY